MRNAWMIAVFVLGLVLLQPRWADSQQGQPATTSINCSGTITSGGTAQQIIPVSGKSQVVHGFQIQNLSTDPLAFSEFTATPAVVTNGSWTLNPATATTAGGSYNTPATYAPQQTVFIIGATTSDKFSCAYW